MDKKLFSYLKDNSIEYTSFSHPAMFKVSDEKNIKETIPGEKSKNLFLKDNKDNFYLVIWEAYSRLPISKLKNLLKVRSLEFASPDELKNNLGVTPGSVSIFSMINATNVRLIVDNRLWESKESGYHPNENTSTLVLTKENLHRFVDSLKIKYDVISLRE